MTLVAPDHVWGSRRFRLCADLSHIPQVENGDTENELEHAMSVQ